ncbi:MAG: sodium-translocating pyrophosphatase [Elusimicrobia bacterium RIFCSPLOWO2_12_FULL_59_9]|nr:MAG: sodium-translocating pyrophosphatase [Elusimicrobia bacterium RIFCSPLOWO2_12_FULL_59_9]
MTSVLVAFATGILGLFFVAYLAKTILEKDPGNALMQKISESIHQGAMAFLKREYTAIGVFVAVMFFVLAFAVAKITAVAFVFGAVCSLTAGYIGMEIATRANTRTAWAASKSYNDAIAIAFPGGAVMGISVVGIGLGGFSLAYFLITAYLHKYGLMPIADSLIAATNLVAGFSMGASSVALFARCGGGIYTKAADVGADLVGKVEAGIPEDDPRNPAVIADNVGDNVGDVAGMGADLYESYIGAILSAMVIAAAPNPLIDLKGVMLTFLLAAWGILATIVGVFFVRTKEGGSPQAALNRGMIVSSILFALGAFALCGRWYGDYRVFWAVMSGLLSGLLIGFIAQVYTSGDAVKRIAESAKTGPATAIIQGLAVAMKSTVVPLVGISIATIVAYRFAGIFGIGLSAVGMLALTGMTVAVDAYGPIADNAAGIAEMSKLGPEARRRAETLDAIGNTTAAIGKGFAIGSAALTALALFVAYGQLVNLAKIDALDPKVVAGLFIGGMIPFAFSAMTMQAVGRAAFSIVEEVRRQFKEIPGLMEGKVMPDSAKCVDITTRGALKEMIAPGVMAVVAPILVGAVMGKECLGGFLVGSIVTGVPLAIFFANAGGAWDNAKKYVEEGNLGGKGSAVHKATVIGDTIGDPLKDTAGPSLNILLKLMTVVALVFGVGLERLHALLMGALPFLR